MKKVRLEVVGLSYSQTQSGAYALVLGELGGKRRLPIIIGGFEAQAIAIEIEKMTPSRPLTHDLFKSFATSFDIEISEIIIYNLVEGVFFAKLICKKDGKEQEIDARTSDAIAIAVRFECPIYTYEFILSQAGVVLDESTSLEEEFTEKPAKLDKPQFSESDLATYTITELNDLLNNAIEEENYEKASKIRDELHKRDKNN
ncbi:MAG: bifunctional nuclease family protein [Bacteroidota bacterium]